MDLHHEQLLRDQGRGSRAAHGQPREGQPLVHTRQLVPVDREGKIVGAGSVEKQVKQVLDNLEAVLSDSGSSLGQLVRLNVYAIEPSTVDCVREQLAARLEPAGELPESRIRDPRF